MRRLFVSFVVGALTIVSGRVLQADVKLPAVFGEHMVLQQQIPIKIWGWADPEEKISVSIGGNKAEGLADANGRWKVELPAMTASKDPKTISVQGKNTVEIRDVLIGEVWLCSGQSNMEWPVAACTNAAKEIESANFPLIRHIKVPLVQSSLPLDNFQSSWQTCSPSTAGGFTACGYFMARQLHQELDIPIGLVNSSWGGTRIEPWTPPVGFEKVQSLKGIFDSVMSRTPGSQAYRSRLAMHTKTMEEWVHKANAALVKSEQVAPHAPFPSELTPFTSNQDPTMLYNGMIHSLVGFPIRGAIWYQGESNHAEGMTYVDKKKALVQGWRELWGQGDFPFYYVQIAPYRYGTEDPEILARFWEAQAACQSIPKTGMVVINDIATLNDIHPPNKQDVGVRLALLALKNDYDKKSTVAHSPELESLVVEENSLKLKFKNSGGGLKTRDGKEPTHFEVIGVGSGGFQPAVARIEGDTLTLTSSKVKSPLAFRFAWNMLAEPNLTGGTGLPVGACRGGELPTFASSIPTISDYKLVYELDLGRMNHDIKYDVDQSKTAPEFDRIAYLLELGTGSGESKGVFVSMNAFTNDVKKIGVPTIASKARFQTKVSSMDVFSNVSGIKTGTKIETGNIEFWPDNYGMQNALNVPGASTTIYDFGDEIAVPEDGYGSMQVHNYAAGQTLFAINHWGAGENADIGIGNGPEKNLDWTFTGGAGTYAFKKLKVFVRPIKR